MKVNRKDFTSETLKKMKAVTKETKHDEMGFVLCRRDDGKITYGQPTCVGESCSIDTGKSKCKHAEKDIGIFHTHTTNDIASIEDLVIAHDQDVMCVGRKTLIPFPLFNYRIDCYTVIDRKTKKYADKVYEDYNRIRNSLQNKVEKNQISSKEAHIIKNNEFDKHTKKLLPLFHIFKV